MNSDLKNQPIEDIFEVLGIDDMTVEEKGLMFTNMMEVVENRALKIAIDSLDDAQKDELIGIIDTENAEAMDEFLEKYVPNFIDLFFEEARKLRMEMIEEFA